MKCPALPRLAAITTAVLALAGPAAFAGSPGPTPAAAAASAPHPRPLDRSGRARVGKASYYSHRFAGRTMADGQKMDPQDDNAASKTLPLGTRARVTNLETGRSATVTIQDRGPYAKGRIIDLSPATAREIGIDHHDGVAPVVVAPIAVPQADGSIKPGVAAPP
jgi:rare lipoprotein A